MCFMVLSGQTQRVLRPPHTRNDHTHTHTHTRGRVSVDEDRPDSTHLAALSVCVCVCPMQCMLCVLGKPELAGLR